MDNIITQRKKLVVIDEHTLGIIHPDSKYAEVLHESILKGAPFRLYPDSVIVEGRKVRLASAKDFEDYRCVFGAFNNRDEFEFAIG